MYVALWTATIGYVESGMSFQELLTFLESAHPYVLIFGKFAVAWPFCFHGINGIRHLVSPTEVIHHIIRLKHVVFNHK